jgi:hypothetical protein
MFNFHFFLFGLQLDQALVGRLEDKAAVHRAILVLVHPQRRLPGKSELSQERSLGQILLTKTNKPNLT